MVNPNVAIDPLNFDYSVAPTESFYRHVNGGWLARTNFPGDESRWGTFSELDAKSKNDLKEIFESFSNSKEGTALIAELFLSGMNEQQIEDYGFEPINDALVELENIQDKTELLNYSAKLQLQGLFSGFWYTLAIPDLKNSNVNMVMSGQNGISLPDKEYYVKETHLEKQKKFVEFVSKLFVEFGYNVVEAQKIAELVFSIEKRIAEFSVDTVDRRDIEKMYHKMSLEKVCELAPSINWAAFYGSLGLKDLDQVNLERTEFFQEIDKLISETDLQDLKLFIKAHVLIESSQYLPKRVADHHFDFFVTALTGVKERKPRFKTVIEFVGSKLGDDVSRLYVEKHFGDKAKAAAKEMVSFILEAFKERLETIDWMTEGTKVKALEKLSTFKVKIGYPDQWEDYSSLNGVIKRSNAYLTNVRAASEFATKLLLKEAGQLVDKEKWRMPAYMVNAYYNPLGNEIVFPAGILQPPFFYAPTDEYPLGNPAMNFGAIGMVISHEISHGYDDQGRAFDAQGNMNDWWQTEDSENFKSRAEKIIAQFNEYEFFGRSLNGKLCQGENIADLGGINVSYLALQKYISKHPQLPMHKKYTLEQLFFISFAQIWRNLIRKEKAIDLLISDPHSPGEFRVDGTLANLDTFHRAFGVLPGDRMYREAEKRVSIW